MTTQFAETPVEGQEPVETDVADETQDGQEPTETAFEELPESWQTEIRRLRRENASKRVSARDAARKQTKDAPASDEPSAQALKAAEERGRKSAALENGIRLARAEVRASLAGTLAPDHIDEIVEDLNLSRFVDDDGEVDTEAVAVLRDKYTSILGRKAPAKVSHGKQGDAPSTEEAETKRLLSNLFGG